MNWGQRITVTLTAAAAGIGAVAVASAPVQAAETSQPPAIHAECQDGEWEDGNPTFWNCQPTGVLPDRPVVIHAVHMWIDGEDRGGVDVSCQDSDPVSAPVIHTDACQYLA
ncbi:MAG TPA: hypothetical protein VE172_24390 [Stackebrandtia sp.]|uniref:hypothetical protein n=1 Tax=Stackebrandtia sp. TaxID=2023065 RepID=UPI002D279FA4|nr:hypothetical protein [Stackebrandtia sp.]HZE41950.1 hypothetical protein [Stackebrandtia sp.]